MKKVNNDKLCDDWNWHTSVRAHKQRGETMPLCLREWRGAWEAQSSFVKLCNGDEVRKGTQGTEKAQSRMCRVGGRHLMHTYCGEMEGGLFTLSAPHLVLSTTKSWVFQSNLEIQYIESQMKSQIQLVRHVHNPQHAYSFTSTYDRETSLDHHETSSIVTKQ